MTAWSERLVRRTGGVLEKRVSRRSFIARTTMLGAAVAVTGTKVLTRPVSSYAAILACPPGSLCLDGYTEFCCVINGGKNTCPPGTVPSGWWNAGFSYFCGGQSRYIIDCNSYSGGVCQCALGDCNRRKIYCNHFRYGQCNRQIGGTGVIACRVALCQPPYTVAGFNCDPSYAADTATAYHIADCLIPTAKPPPPPPPQPAAVLPVSASVVIPETGRLSAFVRGSDGGVWYRDFDGSSWLPWRTLGGRPSSTIVAAVRGSDTYVFARETGSLRLIYRRRVGAAGPWSSWQSLGGALLADPSVVVHSNTLWLFERANDQKLYYRVLLGTKWAGWFGLGGNLQSDPVAVSHPAGLHVFQRTTDHSVWFRRWSSGWTPWRSLSGSLTSDPAPVTHNGALYLFQRANDHALWYRVSNGAAWSSWKSLGGSLTSDPVAVSHGDGLYVFQRGGNGRTLYYKRYANGSWSPWISLQGWLTADPAAVSTADGLYVFQRANDAALWYKRWDGSLWSEWVPLGGVLAPVRAWA